MADPVANRLIGLLWIPVLAGVQADGAGAQVCARRALVGVLLATCGVDEHGFVTGKCTAHYTGLNRLTRGVGHLRLGLGLAAAIAHVRTQGILDPGSNLWIQRLARGERFLGLCLRWLRFDLMSMRHTVGGT